MCCRYRKQAEQQLDFYAAPQETLWAAWEDGEGVWFYRIEHRVGRGWCVVKYARDERIEDEAPF